MIQKTEINDLGSLLAAKGGVAFQMNVTGNESPTRAHLAQNGQDLPVAKAGFGELVASQKPVSAPITPSNMG